MSRRRTWVLIGVHVLIAAHIVQWKLTGSTISPVEPSEAMQTLERGRVNAGFIFFVAAILATLVFGRFFCGWGCHVVALQDLCGAIMRRFGIRPRAFRSRLLAWIPAGLAIYMFLWPTLRREVLAPLAGAISPTLAGWIGAPPPFPGFSSHIVETDFWQTFPGIAVAIPFLLICGFAVVYFLGSKGFCTYGCPYGGVFGPVDRLAPGKIVADLDACEGCGHCTATCTSNVRVHEEIQVHGRVVDSGCMKCMDCVSVCPNEALSFGFARPSAFGGEVRRPPKPRRYDLGFGEEIALGLVFLATFLSVRGAYTLVPMLMAVGIALSTTYLVWMGANILRRRSVSIHKTSLKHGGRLRPAGVLTFAAVTVLVLLVVHTGIVRYHAWRGDRLDRRVSAPREAVIAGTASIPDDVRERARAARDHYARARGISAGGIGLVDTPDLAVRVAWLDLVLGERERSVSELEGLFETEPTDALALEIGALHRSERGPGAEAAFYARALERDADLPETRLRLGRMLAESGRTEEAEALYRRHLAANPGDADARATLGSLLLALGRQDEATSELERAVSDAPRRASVRHDLAVALFMSGRHAAAIEEMARAVELDPEDASLRARLEEMRRVAGSAP
jgi:Flp pilus assembly protein TadD/NAD-dependent dihydropyrimidine dehydrogenase PreA subunit